MNGPDRNDVTIGILALQGDFDAHRKMFEERLSAATREVRTPEDLANVDDETVRGVFIRAPYVTEARDGVHVLARFRDRIVAVQQGNLLATAFHPELTDNPLVHAHFLEMVRAARPPQGAVAPLSAAAP